MNDRIDAPQVSLEWTTRRVIEYDAQGWHRTGSEVSQASSRWLAELVRGVGVEPVLEPVTFDRVAPRDGFLQIGDERIPGLPMFDGGFTAMQGVTGRIGGLQSDAPIRGTDYAAWAGPKRGARKSEIFPLREHRGIEAIVMATIGPAPGLAPTNSDHFQKPYGPPVLMIGSEASETLADSIAAERRVTVGAHVEREPGTDHNVEAEIVGTDPSLKPVVVMTPRGAWWTCTAERVGGIICWLVALRELANQRPRRTVRFVASTGHELGHLGIRQYMAAFGPADAASVWVHLGASIGAAVDPKLGLFASDEALMITTRNALDRGGAEAFYRPRPIGAKSGEAERVAESGGRFISLMGAHGLVHLESDRWPRSVDATRLQALARGMAAAIVGLAQA